MVTRPSRGGNFTESGQGQVLTNDVGLGQNPSKRPIKPSILSTRHLLFILTLPFTLPLSLSAIKPGDESSVGLGQPLVDLIFHVQFSTMANSPRFHSFIPVRRVRIRALTHL
jgi:hypothetical protein